MSTAGNAYGVITIFGEQTFRKKWYYMTKA